MKLLPFFFAALTIFPVSLTEGGPKNNQIKPTGTFSNMSVVEETGDVVGYEITIIPGGGYWVLYQEAEGEPAPPKLVQARVNGLAIEFTVTGLPGNPRIFKGNISSTTLTGSLSGSNETIKLPRKRSYWQ